jgi:hypothetical protein
MSIFQSLFALGGMIVACIGYGLLTLSAFRADQCLRGALERVCICFILGGGISGWILFFPGVLGAFSPAIFWAVIAVGILFFALRYRTLCGDPVRIRVTGVEALLLAAIALAAGFDLLEGLSPPADADTLAYHFSLPRDFLVDGRITFVPRAISGAIPLLVHMNYAAALATGGELTLTLWTMVTGWAPAILLYAVARRHIDRSWALALLAIFVTTPAVLYGGGSGQIEIRCAAFALATVILLLGADRESSLRILAIAGLCAGFFVGAKFYGLIFAGAAGVVILFHRDGLRRCLIFGLAITLTGFQWYLWNWMHTGDPVFPMLTNLLIFADSSFWTREFGHDFAQTLAQGELYLDRTLLNWISYPVLSIFNIVEQLEGGRTGFGILSILILPLSIVGMFRLDRRQRELLVPIIIAAIFFTVWFFSGTAQRTRHLLPIYPLIILGLFPVAAMVAQQSRLVFPLAAGLAAILSIQLTGQAVFSKNFVEHAFTSESRAAFYRRNVADANAAQWLNGNLPAQAKVGYMVRHIAYLIERPAFKIHHHIQAVIDARPTVTNERKFIAQVRAQGLTHLLVPGDWQNVQATPVRAMPFFDMIGRLIESGCLQQQKRFDTISIRSRTLRQFGETSEPQQLWLFALNPDRCPIERSSVSTNFEVTGLRL